MDSRSVSFEKLYTDPFVHIIIPTCTGVNPGGMGGMHPPALEGGGMACTNIPPEIQKIKREKKERRKKKKKKEGNVIVSISA